MQRGRLTPRELELELRRLQREIWERAARDFTLRANYAKSAGYEERAGHWAAAAADAKRRATCEKRWRAI